MRTLSSLMLVALVGSAAHADRAPSSAAAPAAPPRAPARPAAAPAAARPMPPPAPAVPLAPIDVATVAPACQSLARQAVSPSLPEALTSRITLARCMAEQAIAPLSLCDCGESIASIDAAVAPALAILDDVIEHAGPATQLMAEHTEGQLHDGFAARMTATLPRLGPEATEAEIALRDVRAQALDAQLAAWREAAQSAYQHVVEIAKAHPELTTRPPVAAAVRDSTQRLAPDVAER